MVRILMLAMTMLLVRPAGASDVSAYGDQLSFTALRDGRPIGTHRLTFDRRGDRLVVATTIEFAVKFLGVTAYRYSHRNREVWLGKELFSFEATTDDDGQPFLVRAQRSGDQLTVERTAPGTAGTVREVFPSVLLPSTHWNFRQTTQRFLLNAQKGTKDEVAVTPVGRETIQTGAGTIAATRYRYGGGVRMDQWFDDQGRWVKSRFAAFDGSTIDYVLQN